MYAACTLLAWTAQPFVAMQAQACYCRRIYMAGNQLHCAVKLCFARNEWPMDPAG